MHTNARFAHQNKHVMGIRGSHKKKDIRSREWPTKSKEDPQERSATSQGNHGAEILNLKSQFCAKNPISCEPFGTTISHPTKCTHLELLSYFLGANKLALPCCAPKSQWGWWIAPKEQGILLKRKCNGEREGRLWWGGGREGSSSFNPYMQRAHFSSGGGKEGT